MPRTQRLFELLQILRRHRHPVSGKYLAEELNISLRTLYRDIATLQAQGAVIEGEPGIGYVLRPGFILPPLMFSEEEVEALVLGSRWVAKRADKKLRLAASNVLAKIAAVLPQNLKYQLEYSGLFIAPPKTPIEKNDEYEALIRQAIRNENKLLILYTDAKDNETSRTIWPVAIGFFEEVHVIAAWCELRSEFRHFRTDKIIQLDTLNVHFAEPRHLLLKKWRRLHNIPE